MQRDMVRQIGDLGDASKTIFTVDVDRILAANNLAAGAAERQGIVLRLGFDQRIEQHPVGLIEDDLVVFQVRLLVLFRIVTVDAQLH